MKKTKVLLVQEHLMRYREATYIQMSKQMDLTLAYVLKNDIKKSNIPIMKLPFRKIGPIYLKFGIDKILNKYDVVIIPPHLKFPTLVMLPFYKHKYKLITWSIGIRASYKLPYDLTQKPDFLGKIVGFMLTHSDAAIFYMPAPIDYWVKYISIDRKKCFVAHNTVPIEKYDSLPDYATRKSILFVGTLYKQKGVESLIHAYADAKTKVPFLNKLVIVGDGDARTEIEELIDSLHMNDCIELLGAIFDEYKLMKLHLEAGLSVSPNQAGLSVLKSMGYGVPFVTKSNSITGGERLNIKTGYNGILYENDEDLSNVLIDYATNLQKFSLMADNARDYYENEASISKMAQGVIDAVNYVMNRN